METEFDKWIKKKNVNESAKVIPPKIEENPPAPPKEVQKSKIIVINAKLKLLNNPLEIEVTNISIDDFFDILLVLTALNEKA